MQSGLHAIGLLRIVCNKSFEDERLLSVLGLSALSLLIMCTQSCVD